MRRGEGAKAIVSLLLVLTPAVAGACPVCFGGANSIGKGTDAAIWFLLSIVGLVQIGFVALFASFWYRARQMRRKREQFRLIEGGAR